MNEQVPRFLSLMRGFTLLEVLIALVIFSVGLLGLAGLQMSSLRSNNGAQSRTQATLVLQDLAERMNVNPVGVQTAAYSGVAFASLNCAAVPAPFCADSASGTGASCSPGEMAAFDAWEVYCTAVDALNAPTLAVTASGDLRTLTIGWSEPAPEGGFESKSVSMTVQQP